MKEQIRKEVMKVYNQESSVDEVVDELLVLFNVSNRRELLIDFLEDVLMCQDEGATIVDREKYVDGYLGN